MSTTFLFSRLPEIFFGTGKFELLPSLVEKIGKRLLIITGKSSFQKSGQCSWLYEELEKNGIYFETVSISGEPSPGFVDSVCNNFRGKNIEAIVSIGGGSVIDAGKAVSAMLTNSGSIMDYLEDVGAGKKHDGRKVPFIAVPTTSGTGSEATKNSVLGSIGDTGFKKSLRHDNFVPDVALLDPLLTVDCPPKVTAASGLDALCQLIESYTSTIASPMTDSLALSAITNVKGSLLRVYIEGSDIEARSQMSYAAMISGITLANAGLGVVHGFASPIGGYFDIPHGVICGTLLGEATRINIEKIVKSENKQALGKYAEIGRIFTKANVKSDEYCAKSFIQSLELLIEQLHIPKLGTFGVKENDIEKIVNGTGIKYNPVKLDRHDLVRILRERI